MINYLYWEAKLLFVSDKEPSMKKTGLIFSAFLFSFCIVFSSSALADKGSHDSNEHGSADSHKLEEGSGTSAVQSGKEYKSEHEGEEEEGSFSYKRHRKEMKDKEKAMQEGMHAPEGDSGHMQEGSGKE